MGRIEYKECKECGKAYDSHTNPETCPYCGDYDVKVKRNSITGKSTIVRSHNNTRPNKKNT